MTLNQLTYFRTVAETGNMRQAAEVLYISQPSLSASIANLEAELGVALFERRHQRLFLTTHGEAFLAHCRQIQKDLEDARDHMKILSDEEQQFFRIGMITPFLRDYFPKKMQAFQKLPGNENVSFTFSNAQTPELVQGLKNGIFDLLLCSANEDPEVRQIPIRKEPLVFISPKKEPYVLECWESLSEFKLIGYLKDSVMDRLIERAAGEHGVKLHFLHRAPGDDSIISLVEYGFGNAIIPKNRNLMYYDVSCTPLPGSAYYRTVYLTTLRDHPCRGAAARFANFLEKDVKKGLSSNTS
ncbi:LysR family transcriptional regulator [[Clostridium] aminophilum]|uniref:Transcriptional regulator, LysR family n=1 Tax=[Clostridium] aminophilum TaxID=1526 RepID=A0A1I6J785_9FIRM|nr:LysR family transcriptional regulator [[Clostridium] aminophilum]SFR74390.1 transcriptional regulator, LysR family [[Clostridium] aminophilum]